MAHFGVEIAHHRLLWAGVLALCAGALCGGTLHAANEDKDFNYAQHLYKMTEYKLAVEGFTQYLTDFPKSERADQARLLLAESYYQMNDFARAAAQFDKFLADYPSSARRADALQRAVKVCWHTRNHARAVEHAEVFLKENRERLGKPDSPPALRVLFEVVLYYAGDSSYGLKKPQAAREYWERLQKDFPDSKLLPDTVEGLAWLAFDAGRFEDAAKGFGAAAAVAGHPKAAASQLMLARALNEQNQSEQALAALEKAPGLTGGKELTRDVTLWRGSFLLKAKRFADALAQFKALAQNFAEHADSPRAIFQAAVQCEDQNMLPEALQLADLYLASFARGPERPAIARLRARVLSAQKKTEAALLAAQGALKEADALPPASPEAREQRPPALMLLAECAGAAGKSHYETVLRDYPGTRFAASARYQLAFLAAQAEKLDEALSHAESLLKELPAEEPKTDKLDLRRKTLFAASDFAFRLKQMEKAENYLKVYSELPGVKAEPAATQLSLVLLRQGWCRHGAGDFDGAVGLLDRALTAGPAPELRAEILYLRGRARLDARARGGAAGELAPDDKIVADYSALLKDTPNSDFAAHGCYDLGQLYARSKQPALALQWLDRLLENPAFAQNALRTDGLFLRANVRYGLGRHAEALSDIEALLKHPALDKKEQFPAALALKALCQEATAGNEAAAEKTYTEIIDKGGAGAAELRLAQLRRGRLRFNAKRFEEAKADFSALLGDREPKADDGGEVEATVLLAVCRKELKDNAGAQALLEKLARLPLSGPAAFEVPFQLGNVAYESNRHGEAATQYQKALDAATKLKDLPASALSAAWLNLAWSQQRAGETKKADAAFGELLKLDPKGSFAAEARYQRGLIAAESGNLDAALAEWRQVVAEHADNPLAEKALAAQGSAQARAARFREAAVDFEKYLKQYPAGASIRDVWCGLAECRLHTNNAPGAREAFMKALGEHGLDGDLDDIGERAVLGLAELALAKGEGAECKKLALKVVIGHAESKWLDAALYLCAKASEDMAEPNQAIGYYRKLLEDRPKSERAATARERLKALGAPAVDSK